MSDKLNPEIPSNWETERYEFTGHSKLIAKFVSPHTEDEIHIVPYKSYGIPGLSNCHRITLTGGDTVQLVAEGLEVETPEEAKETAIKAMRKHSEGS